MKKFLIIILTALILLPACSVGQGAVPGKSEAELVARIISVSENGGLFVAGDGANQLYSIGAPQVYYDAIGKNAGAFALKAGHPVVIGFDGQVAESYPMQISKPDYVQITGEASDLVGLYRNIFSELWETDPGLNSDISILVFDLTEVTNLTDGEKDALIWLESGAHGGLQGMAGTFDELVEQGLIDGENLYFKTGLLIKITVTDSDEESVTFNISKWRSGLGAYGFNDCKAKRAPDGSWSYTRGGEWIS
ncbi:MAG: hypothetical protein ACYCWE_03615 [Eubacteriales bacterium]